MDRPMLFWRILWRLALLTSITSWSLPAHSGSRAIAQDGNIFVVRSDGSRLQITFSALDSQPDLTSDETMVVFVRKTNTGASEIWIARVETPASARVLVKPPLEINGRKFSQVFTPKFASDGTSVYFLIPYAATTQAIVKIDIARPEPQFIAAALKFQVVPAGQYRGDLVAQIRKAKLAPGYYEWYWLLTPEGKEIGLVGQDDRDVALFMEQHE